MSVLVPQTDDIHPTAIDVKINLRWIAVNALCCQVKICHFSRCKRPYWVGAVRGVLRLHSDPKLCMILVPLLFLYLGVFNKFLPLWDQILLWICDNGIFVFGVENSSTIYLLFLSMQHCFTKDSLVRMYNLSSPFVYFSGNGDNLWESFSMCGRAVSFIV